MTPALKALAALLAYPDERIAALTPEIAAALAGDRDLSPALRRRVIETVYRLRTGDLLDAQETYVSLFDRTRSLSLHLFEHVHGDSRERGPAMVDLLGIYRRHGLEIADNELPDFLPLYLEYASVLDGAAAKSALADVAPIVGAIRDRLAKRGSPYAAVFDAVLSLADVEVAATAAEKPEDDDLAALDREWEEAAVTFGPDSDPQKDQGCGRAAAMLQRMNAV